MSIEPYTRPRIAVLLASFQGEAYIEAQLDSILAQTVPGIQIIVSDDGSTDQTRRILERHQRYYPEQIVLRHRDKDGEFKNREPFIPAPAMNFFWLMSQTDADYVLLSDQDDVWDSRKVEKLLWMMREFEVPGLPALVYSDMEVVDAGLREISPSFFAYSHIDPDRYMFPKILVENAVTGGALMMNRSLLQLARKVPRACFMHDWWIALCASCFGHMICVREPLSLYRQHQDNVLGARATGSVRGLWQRSFRKRQVEDNYCRMFMQAAAFGEMHWKQMETYERIVLKAFLSLPEKTPAQRLRTIGQHYFYKTSWLQTIAQCVTIPKDVKGHRKDLENRAKKEDMGRRRP